MYKILKVLFGKKPKYKSELVKHYEDIQKLLNIEYEIYLKQQKLEDETWSKLPWEQQRYRVFEGFNWGKYN
jgi:hypothetical protein